MSIPKTNENFRLLYDTKGRFRLHSIRDDEAKVCVQFLYVPTDFDYLNCLFISISFIYMHDNKLYEILWNILVKKNGNFSFFSFNFLVVSFMS